MTHQMVRAALWPGEHLREFSPLQRSPGLEQAPPGALTGLNTFNPFAGFPRAVRKHGLVKAFLATVVLGEGREQSSPSSIMIKNKELDQYGQTFCGTENSAAERLLETLRRFAPGAQYAGGPPLWLAVTDRRLIIFADSPNPPRDLADQFLHRLVMLPVRLVRLARGTDRPEPQPQPADRVYPIFECPVTAVEIVPAAPLPGMPRVALRFTDRSWLVVGATVRG